MILRKCCIVYHGKVTARIPIAILCFLACFVSYSVRLVLNMAIIAMVSTREDSKGSECKHDGNKNENQTRELPDYGPRYDWDVFEQAQVKAAYGYGYFIAHFPAGILSDMFGARVMILAAILTQAIINVPVPILAQLHWGAVFAARFIAGLGGGVVYPALHALVAQWAPPEEKGKFIFSVMGGTLSSVVTFSIVAAITESMSWMAAYYYATFLCIGFLVFWVLLAYDSPSKHPFISDHERDYIVEALGGSVKVKKPPLNLRKVLASVPFWALVVLHFGNLWGLFLLTTDTPTFFTSVLGFNMQEGGALGGVPSLGRLIMSLVFGEIVDVITSRGLWKNKTSLRKTFIVFSHIIPGVLMMCLGFVGCNINAAIVLLTLGMTMNGASTVTNLINHHDLAPNYAGSMYGFMNGIGSTTLWIVPSVTGACLKSHPGVEGWQIIYILGASMYLVAGIFFIALGSGKMQPWNNPEGVGAAASEQS